MFGIDDALLVGGMNLLGTAYQNAETRQSVQDANAFSASQFAKRYQTTVADLKAAGLSPMLAYGQGGGSPPTGQSYQAQNPGLAGTQAYVAAANLGAQREALEAGAARDRGSAWKSATESEFLVSQMKQINATVDEIQQRISSNLPASLKALQDADTRLKASQVDLNRFQREVLIATAINLNEQTELNAQRGLTEQQQRQVMMATIKKLQNETDLLDFDLKAASDLGNVGREYGQLKPIIDVILNAIRVYKH